MDTTGISVNNSNHPQEKKNWHLFFGFFLLSPILFALFVLLSASMLHPMEK